MSRKLANPTPDKSRFRTANRSYARSLYNTRDAERLESGYRSALEAGAYPFF